MAADQGTYFDLSDPEVRQDWEKQVMVQVTKRCTLLNPKYGLIGNEDTNMIQRRTEAFKEGGSRATITLIRQLRQKPAYGNQTLRDQEEGIPTATFQWDINQLRHAVKIAGVRITQQRVTWDVWQRSLTLMGEYWPKVLEAGMCMHLAGFTVDGSTQSEWYHDGTHLGMTLNNVPRAADTKHIYRPNGAADDLAVSTDPSARIDLNTATILKTIAKNLPIPIRPCMTPWGEVYVFLVHSYAIRHLKENSRWLAMMRDTLKGGAIDGNPLFTGALGLYDEVLWVEANYLPPGFVSSTIYRDVRRNVFCGAQALALGFGKMFKDESTFVNEQESWDYANNKGVAASTLMGAKSPYFSVEEQGTTEDFGKIVVPSYAQELVTST